MLKVVRESDSQGLQRSRASRIIEQQPVIAGSIVDMVHTCGKPGCRCGTGEKHVSPYLAVRRKGKRTMISIPRHMEEEIRQSVSNYKELSTLIDELSSREVNAFVARKKRGA